MSLPPAIPQPDALVVAIIAIGMGAAAVIDLRTRRVPNLLTASLAAIGLGIAAAGLGRIGLGASILGCLLGLAFMLPGHIYGATGAGDVKLLAAAGALLGPADTVVAFLNTAIAGGVLALSVALYRRRLHATLGATARLMARRPEAVSDIESPATDNRFAYAPAIAIGVIVVALGW
jgi:prepilin peptidase CpaA